ncbi:retrotransposon protein, putative, ty1-copia subclass [Tanacetum coccineum]
MFNPNGDCIECMAAFNNAVRVGLTPKYMDVKILYSMLINKQSTKSHETIPVEDLGGGGASRGFMENLMDVYRVMTVFFVVISGEGSMHTSSSEDMVMKRAALFAPAGMEELYGFGGLVVMLNNALDPDNLKLMTTSVGNKSVFRSFLENKNLPGPNFMMQVPPKALAAHAPALKKTALPKKDANPALHAIRAGRVQKNQKNKPHKAAKGGHDNPAKDAICHNVVKLALERNCLVYLADVDEKEEAISVELALQGLRVSKSRNRAKNNVTSSRLVALSLDTSARNALKSCNMKDLSNSIDIESLESVFHALSGYPKETIGYSFYNLSENKVFVARNVEFFENDYIDLKASGSVEDLELIQEEDTNPSVDTSLNHEEDDQNLNEPHSDINPSSRTTRQRRPTDRLCLYIDVEEHELGDLSEPANYKVALLDPESKK